jgi:peptide/nickel transport system substrate-binding protein
VKRRRLAIVSVFVALMFVFTACGSGSQGVDTQAGVTKSGVTEIIKAEAPEKLPASASNRKDTLIAGITAPEGKFNPIYSSTLYDSYVCDLVFDPLLFNDEQGNPIPWVAEKWEISPDGKTYTFYIKKGIKFSSGDELTAEDVAFTYTAICDPKYDGMRADAVNGMVGYKEYHEGDAKEVAGIKVIDPYTVSFTLEKVNSAALLNVFTNTYGIMSKKYYGFEKGNADRIKDLFLKPMGSGPYIFKEYKAGQEISFEKSPTYWGGEIKIPKVIMKVTDATTNIQELVTGSTDLDRIPAKPENITMLKNAGFINMQLYPENGYGYIGLNLKNELFKDIKVRQALMYGLNRKGFVDAYYKGYATTCDVPIATVSWAYTDKVEKYDFNPDKANQLLDEAGWVKKDDGFRYKDGKKFTIHWMTYTGSKYVDTLIPIVKDNWGKLGIEVIPELMEFSTLSGKVYDEQAFEMYNMAWSLSLDPDPSGIFSKEQTTPGGSNSVSWVNEESEKLMAEGLLETDQAKRKEIYQKWAIVANRELPYLFLSTNKEMWAVSDRVKGMELSPFITWTYMLRQAELAS